jgi:hypothetical protein
MQAARLPLQLKIAIADRGLVSPTKAERVREGSAAKSIRRTKMRRAAPCRETMMPARWAKTQPARTLQREDRHRKTWRHRAPSFSLQRERLRAGFCSTALARLAVFALPAWNETGRRLAPNRFSSPQQRTRNDSRSRTRNRSPPRRLRTACSHSSRTSIAHARRISNVFLRRNRVADGHARRRQRFIRKRSDRRR